SNLYFCFSKSLSHHSIRAVLDILVVKKVAPNVCLAAEHCLNMFNLTCNTIVKTREPLGQYCMQQFASMTKHVSDNIVYSKITYTIIQDLLDNLVCLHEFAKSRNLQDIRRLGRRIAKLFASINELAVLLARMSEALHPDFKALAQQIADDSKPPQI